MESETPTSEVVEPVQLTPEQQKEARARAEQCGQEIYAVLEHHNCRIVPFLRPLEWVGGEGTKALISASYGVVPNLS